MKILFIYPNIHTPYSFSPAIQQLSAVLKKAGHETYLIHINNTHGIPFDFDRIKEEYFKIGPDLICITATSFEFKEANELAKLIKSITSKLVILGGIHATICPQDLEMSNFDAFCIGEGEKPILELVYKLNLDVDISNTRSFRFNKGFCNNKDIIKNPIRKPIENLDDLPPYDMKIINTKKLLKLRQNWLSIGFSRGCPYSCSFCINPLLNKIIKGGLRKKSVDKVIEELNSMAKEYEINVFNFDDDLLMLDKKWMIEFCEKYKSKIYSRYKIKYAINCRVDTLDKDIITRLLDSGCIELQMGVETANDYLRNGILKKGISKKQIFDAFRLAKENKIRTNTYLMMGVPGETEKTINESISLIADLKPDLIRLTLLQPYIGTEIYDYCKFKKLFKGNKTVDCFTESPLRLSITNNKLIKYKVMFPWYLNLRLSGKGAKNLYTRAIKEFGQMKYKGFLNSFDKILKRDESISQLLSKLNIPHYKYFNDNTYYFQLKCRQ